VPPSTAFSYISRAFRQTTPHVIGALRLLAASFSPQEINAKAWALYADFRPEVDGWGKRGLVTCEGILALRGAGASAGGERDSLVVPRDVMTDVVKFENVDRGDHVGGVEEVDGQSEHKKPRGLSLEEYEAALDADTTFDDIDLETGLKVGLSIVRV
jgi:hypothetical protein